MTSTLDWIYFSHCRDLQHHWLDRPCIAATIAAVGPSVVMRCIVSLRVIDMYR
jgi:hypothetical protein